MANSCHIQVLAQDFLSAIKHQQETTCWIDRISNLTLEELLQSLKTDQEKCCFWINVYNAYYQHLRQSASWDRTNIFSKKACRIAGMQYSLDDIEHGILRRYRYKYSLGYFANPFVAGFIKRLAVQTIDYRIHFALNCGANSCPPITIYQLSNLGKELDNATIEYLMQETDFDEQKHTVHFPRLLWWFYADFGGKKGIQKMYLQYLNRDISGFKIQYKAFDWSSNMGNFK